MPAEHLDAVVAVVLTAGGALLLHMKSVGQTLRAIHELEKDVKDLSVGVRRMNKRFHYLNNYAMTLYATVRIVARELKIEIADIPGYDFKDENGGD